MTETNGIRVMLVDDHAVVRMGFRLLLEGQPDIKVVAEAESGEQACARYPQVRPDVVVMDLSMPGMGGLEAMTRLRARDEHARILVLTAHDDTIHPRRVLDAGALGYLSKRSAPAELIQAVRDVMRGKVYVEPGIAQQMVAQRGGAQNPVDTLSLRELEVFLLLARGVSVAEIANVLHLSPRTVGTHLYHIKQKLGAANQAEMALIAIRAGLLEP
ncbi:MAG TPA: response regulator transcription factor [Burkholderiales bacterium]